MFLIVRPKNSANGTVATIYVDGMEDIHRITPYSKCKGPMTIFLWQKNCFNMAHTYRLCTYINRHVDEHTYQAHI